MIPQYCAHIESLSISELRDELIRRDIDYTYLSPYEERKQKDAWIALLLADPSPKPCDEICEDKVPNKLPLYIPAFHNTYQPVFKTRFPNNHLEYKEPCGGSCSCGPRCVNNCDGISQEQHKKNVLKHGPNYLGTSKKAFYGQYIRNTPGMYTFASKKIPTLQTLDQKNQVCFKTYWCPNK
jgi:hypothetical protein